MQARFVRGQRATTLAYMVVILAAAILVVLVLMPHVSSKHLTPVAEEYVDVVVLEGDTLWHIARRHGGPGTDTRQLVDRIREANGLEIAVVRPGQVLKVPVP